MPEFYKARMGVRFFESTMPKIAEELERLNRNLEAVAKRSEAAQAGEQGKVRVESLEARERRRTSL